MKRVNSQGWCIQQLDEHNVTLLCEKLGIHRLTASVLVAQGQKTPEAAKIFLDGGLTELADPFLMSGMEKAVLRLMEAVNKLESVLVYGDYDVDGVTSTALLALALKKMGLTVEYYIPSRLEEGYGLHGAALERFAANGGKLVITVDCGVNSFAEMRLAQELGLDLIITDHHECFPGERTALAVLNPKQPQCAYPEHNLAGVGVAWSLVRALFQKMGLPVEESASYLDLVAVGTIADIVSLQGENRIMVRYGLEKLRHNPSAGLRALSKQAGLQDTNLTATQVAFVLAPRLNAPGRLGDAAPSAEILMAKNEDAAQLAVVLDECNNKRRQVEKVILEQARVMAKEQEDKPALVLWHEDWHPGVVGIVAGRLAREYNKPAVLIAVDGEEGHGSARCVPGYNLVEGLSQCRDYLLRFGGHPEAAGLSAETRKLESFQNAFCSAIKDMSPEQTELLAVAEAEANELSLDLFEELSRLQPFGQGNPEPIFVARKLDVLTARHVGSRSNHLQIKLSKDSHSLAAIYFGAGDIPPPSRGELLDIAFTLEENSWQNRKTLSLNLCGLATSLDVSEAGFIVDQRGLDTSETFLLRLAANKRLVVWVNTKAALEYLRQRLPADDIVVTQLGRNIAIHECDALAFYHIPYDRGSVEELLNRVRLAKGAKVYLLYGQDALLLNERVFAASIPNENTLRKLAACFENNSGFVLTPDVAGRQLAFPVTNYLLKRASAVFKELGRETSGNSVTLLANLHQSQSYLEDCRNLMEFRKYQSFWWQAAANTLTEYISDPTSFILPEGVCINEPEWAKRAN